ncbi:MAG: hypothetical protein ACKVP3_19780 [Hyphomicrobiaceae bacterium]
MWVGGIGTAIIATIIGMIATIGTTTRAGLLRMEATSFYAKQDFVFNGPICVDDLEPNGASLPTATHNASAALGLAFHDASRNELF